MCVHVDHHKVAATKRPDKRSTTVHMCVHVCVRLHMLVCVVACVGAGVYGCGWARPPQRRLLLCPVAASSSKPSVVH